MKTALECIPCFVRQAKEAVELSGGAPARREALLRLLIHDIADADWDVIPVAVAQRIQRIVRSETGRIDPYSEVKKSMNETALKLMPDLEKVLLNHVNPREAAVRLAAAGNLLDSGAKMRLDAGGLAAHMDKIWEIPLCGDIDAFFNAAAEAGKILYLADNAGEIVFDRLLIEALPTEKIIVAVRGTPVINDATMEDAELAGITKLTRVISNGSDAPGTLLDDCSEEFRACFEDADMIVSKGQGNFETLSDVREKVYFVLTVKCDMIAAAIGAPTGSMVVKKNGDNL